MADGKLPKGVGRLSTVFGCYFCFLLYTLANPGFSRFEVQGSSKTDCARFVEIATGSVFEVVSQATISLSYQLSTINYSEGAGAPAPASRPTAAQS
jgi:hypothetical protein